MREAAADLCPLLHRLLTNTIAAGFAPMPTARAETGLAAASAVEMSRMMPLCDGGEICGEPRGRIEHAAHEPYASSGYATVPHVGGSG